MDGIDTILSPEHLPSTGSGSLPNSLATTLFDAVSDGFAYLDSDFRVLYVSGTAATFIGVSAPSLVGKVLWDALPSLRGTTFEAECLGALREGVGRRFVTPSIVSGGKWVEHRLVPTPQGLAVYILDVTAREEAMEALRISEERSRRIIDSAPACISYIDTECRFRLVNAPFAGFFGEQTERILGRTVREVLGESAWEMIASPMKRAMAGEVVSYEGEAVYNPGGLRIVHATYSPDRDESGNVRGIIALVRDITEERQTQEKLRQSGAHHRMFCESVGVGIVEVDKESGRVVWVNNKYCEMLGYSEEELLRAERFLTFTHPDDRELNLKELHRLDRDGIKEVQFEKRYIRKDGSQLWVHITVTSIATPEGSVPRRVAVVKDITLRKTTEQDLRRSAEELRQMNEAAPVAIWVARDPLCENIVGNLTAQQLLGSLFDGGGPATSPHDVWKQCGSVLGGEVKIIDTEGTQLSITDLPIYRAAATNSEVRDQVLSFMFPDGRQVTVVGSAVPLRDEQGAVRGCIAAFVDISARVKAEDALRESEERLRLAVKASGIGHWTWEVESGRCVMDEVCAKMLGAKIETNVSGVFAHVKSEDRYAIDEQIEASIAHSRPYRAEFRVWNNGPQPRWVRSLGDFERNADGEVIRMHGVNIDITDRKHAEEVLRGADRRKDEFLATLAHELRNPLAPISNALHILRRVEEDPSQVAHLREIMSRQVEQLKRLIDDLLDVSRISQGKIELRHERVDIASVVEDAMESNRPFVEAARHTISNTCSGDRVYVEGDRRRLVQVVGNLIHNAAKYTPSGGRIDVSVHRDGLNAVVRVADNGTGIAQHMLTRIFEPFTQVESNLDRAQGGLGIGLTLVKTLVEMHRGSIEAKSEGLGRGSEFIVSLPMTSLSCTDEPQTQGPSCAWFPSSVALPRRRVLIVDDLKPSADTLAMMLEGLEQDVRVVYDGQSALRIAAEFNPDIIISDVAMPGMDGYRLVERLRTTVKELPLLVALTGYGQTYDHRRALEAGFHRHVVKPISLAVLEDLIVGTQRVPSSTPACASEC